jgi:hypothetical protein
MITADFSKRSSIALCNVKSNLYGHNKPAWWWLLWAGWRLLCATPSAVRQWSVTVYPTLLLKFYSRESSSEFFIVYIALHKVLKTSHRYQFIQPRYTRYANLQLASILCGHALSPTHWFPQLAHRPKAFGGQFKATGFEQSFLCRSCSHSYLDNCNATLVSCEGARSIRPTQG